MQPSFIGYDVGYHRKVLIAVGLLFAILGIRLPVIGKIIGTLGFEQETAILIVALIQSGALAYVAAVWPVLIPFIATVQGLILVFGAATAVAW